MHRFSDDIAAAQCSPRQVRALRQQALVAPRNRSRGTTKFRGAPARFLREDSTMTQHPSSGPTRAPTSFAALWALLLALTCMPFAHARDCRARGSGFPRDCRDDRSCDRHRRCPARRQFRSLVTADRPGRRSGCAFRGSRDRVRRSGCSRARYDCGTGCARRRGGAPAGRAETARHRPAAGRA